MVENNQGNHSSAESLNLLVSEFFKNHFPSYVLISQTAHGPFWGVEYVDRDTTIRIGGDIAFSVKLLIGKQEYPLWQFDRSINDAMDTSEKNVLYQLNVLKKFLGESQVWRGLTGVVAVRAATLKNVLESYKGGVWKAFQTMDTGKLQQLINKLKTRNNGAYEFFQNIDRKLNNDMTREEGLNDLANCFSITQYADFNIEEEQLLSEILSDVAKRRMK